MKVGVPLAGAGAERLKRCRKTRSHSHADSAMPHHAEHTTPARMRSGTSSMLSTCCMTSTGSTSCTTANAFVSVSSICRQNMSVRKDTTPCFYSAWAIKLRILTLSGSTGTRRQAAPRKRMLHFACGVVSHCNHLFEDYALPLQSAWLKVKDKKLRSQVRASSALGDKQREQL